MARGLKVSGLNDSRCLSIEVSRPPGLKISRSQGLGGSVGSQGLREETNSNFGGGFSVTDLSNSENMR